MKPNRFLQIGRGCAGSLLPLILGLMAILPAVGQADETLPFEIPFQDGVTLAEIAAERGIALETLEDLNPSLWTRPERVLLIHQPRTAEEAVLLLEEAKRVEVLGGVGVRKATRIYEGILKAARLIPGAAESAAAVEMPSDAVAQALLGWANIQERADRSQAAWAYHQVRLFFPDRQEFFSRATARLRTLEEGVESDDPGERSLALEWFPFSPHLLIDIDAQRLARQLRRLDPGTAFKPLAEHPDERVRKHRERADDRFEELIEILTHLHSVHIGGWVDPEIYGTDPERGLQESRWVVVGLLKSTFETFVENLGLPSAEGERSGFSLHDLGRGTHLAAREGCMLAAREETLLDLIDRAPPFDHPNLAAPDSAYRRAKQESGADASIFGYFDLEGFLRGPALAFARRGDPRDGEAVVISLILSGIVGINSIQGLFLSLDYERDELAARLGLRHQTGGALHLFAGPPCPSRTHAYFPQETQGLLQILRPCTPAVEAVLNLRLDRFLGLAAPVYLAHYTAWLDRIESEKGFRLDPLDLLNSGVLNEVSLGIQLPGGMVPIPNLLLAAPVSLATEELRDLEKVFVRDGSVEFLEEKAEGHWLRHALIPIEAPLFLDLSYTLHQGTLLVSNNPDLIRQALRTAQGGPGFESSADYREFREEWLPSHHLTLFLSRDLASRLSQWGRVSVASRLGVPEKEPFLRILQSQLDPIARDPEPSGLGVRLADEAMVATLRLRSFRSWINAFLSLRWSRMVEQSNAEN